MKIYKFKAKIEASNGGRAYVLFPYNTEAEFETRGKVPVQATLGGVPYAGSLMTKRPGDTIDVEVWRDDAPRELEVPAPFERLLKREGLLPFFDGLSFAHRKEYCRWVAEARKEETRLKRLEKAVEVLRKGVRTPG